MDVEEQRRKTKKETDLEKYNELQEDLINMEINKKKCKDEMMALISKSPYQYIFDGNNDNIEGLLIILDKYRCIKKLNLYIDSYKRKIERII